MYKSIWVLMKTLLPAEMIPPPANFFRLPA